MHAKHLSKTSYKKRVKELVCKLETCGKVLLANSTVVYKEGNKLVTKLVDINRPLLVIPNVAIHQNRTINDGYKYNPAVDMVALYGSKNGMKLNEIIAKAKEAIALKK